MAAVTICSDFRAPKNVLVVVNKAVMNIGVHVSFSLKGHIIMKSEKEMATYSNILAWKIPWTGELGRVQSTESQRVARDWVTNTD